MSSAIKNNLQTALYILISVIIAANLWYLVVGRDHVETQIDVRVEYRGLPEGLVMRDGLVNRLTIRLRGSAELLRNLHSRDLVYTADLSGLQRGANALPLKVAEMPELKAFQLQEIIPNRLVIEVDTLAERVVPLQGRMHPLPASSPFTISNILLEPSFVTIKGPESRITSVSSLPVEYDPTKNFSEGQHTANVAITAPPQIEVTPPVTSLRYTLETKTVSVTLKRTARLDEGTEDCTINPQTFKVRMAVPEGLAGDKAYLESARVMIRPPSSLAEGESADATPFVMLPSGSRLESIEPATVRVTRKAAEHKGEPSWIPAESPFSMPLNGFGMDLPPSGLELNFSLDDLDLPTPVPQPEELKVQPVMPSAPAGQKSPRDGQELPQPLVQLSPSLPPPAVDAKKTSRDGEAVPPQSESKDQTEPSGLSTLSKQAK